VTKWGLAYQIIKDDPRPSQSVKLAQVKRLCAKRVVVKMQPRLDICMGDQRLLFKAGGRGMVRWQKWICRWGLSHNAVTRL
jgi:hypothetical protein